MRVVDRFGTLGGMRRNIFRNLSSIKEVVIYYYVILSFLSSRKFVINSYSLVLNSKKFLGAEKLWEFY